MCEWIEMLTEQTPREKPEFCDEGDQDFLSGSSRFEEL